MSSADARQRPDRLDRAHIIHYLSMNRVFSFRGDMRSESSTSALMILRRALSRSLVVCALVALTLPLSGVADLAAPAASSSPVSPAEEDEATPASECVSAAESAWTLRVSRKRLSAVIRQVIHPRSHTPATGLATVRLQPPPDHFHNGLGTPLRC
jgi:hypothetical protein